MTTETKRDLVSIDDLSTDEIVQLFDHADRFREELRGWSDVCRGSIMATLFFEPSTRTRLSFESAMLRLGGGVVTAADVATTSQVKGESLADTVRVVGGSYADILVVRHPQDGAARVAARYAQVPVINGGDGSHEHPTQTLCDLFTLWKEKGQLEGLDVVLCGDLRYSRTIHSFAYALARFKANIVTLPYPGFELPQYVIDRLRRDFGVQASVASVGDLPGLAVGENSAAYLTASKPHQLALFTHLTPYQVQHIDAIYMTRAQRERHSGESTENYPRISRDLMRAASMKDARVMHPLPRVDEISYEVDSDPRSVYFRQAELGVPIRMALMAFLLGKIELTASPPDFLSTTFGSVAQRGGVSCGNEKCVTNGEGVRYLVRDFRVLDTSPPVLVCAYCGKETIALFIGNVKSGLFHCHDAAEAVQIESPDRVYFESEEQALSAEFSSSGGA
ncbi:MAG: aspartate carbamoyltransferase catalytic subunit [Planctomycetota bacterium]|jgi:aspartate carbamoyltransferase catalytic subunit|nr:aspartate carbamoyltransferase catalytic subunit [Planctomycetota bacterium]